MENFIEKEVKFEELNHLSKILRKRIIETGANARIPHIGSCLSCVDLLIYIYYITLIYFILAKFNPYV